MNDKYYPHATQPPFWVFKDCELFEQDVGMSDSSMHSTEHPQSSAQDRCAWVESQLFEDIEIGNSSNVESALSKNKANTPQDEVKRSSIKWKAIYYGSLILILLCLVVVPVAFHSGNQGGNNGGNISVASNVQYPGKTTSSCISNITLQQDLLSNIDECEGCSSRVASRVALDGDTTAVVRYDQNIYFYSKNGEEWKQLPTAYRGTYSDTSIAISEKFAVLADFTTNEDNRNVFVFEKGPADTKHKQSFDWHELDEDGSGFGQSLAINGDLMVIGAPGLAYIYQFEDDDWHLATELDSPSISQSNVVAVGDDKVAITGISEEGQAVVFPYKRKNQSGWEMMKEIVVDHCDGDDGCDDASITLAYADDNGLMIGYPRKDTLYYYVLGDGEGAQYELKQEIRLPTGYLPDQVVVSGHIAVAKSSGKSSLLFLVQNDGVWKIKTTKIYSTNLSDMALSDRNLIVAAGHEVLWYTLDDCASIEISRSTTEDTPIPSAVPPPHAATNR